MKARSFAVAAFAVLALQGTSVARADDAAGKQAFDELGALIKGALETAQAGAGDLLKAAKSRVQQVMESAVLQPALGYALERVLPVGDDGFNMIRRLFDRTVRSAEAMKARLTGYAESIEALEKNGAAAFQAAMKKVEAQVDQITSFDVNKALTILQKIARSRAEDLVRTRIAALFEQALAQLMTPIRNGLDKVDEKIRQIPVVGGLLSGLVSDRVSEGVRALRDEALKYVLSKVAALSTSAVDIVFVAARGGSPRTQPWMNATLVVVKGLVTQVQGYASQIQSQFASLKEGLTVLSDVFRPEKVIAEAKVQEAAKQVQAVIAEAKAGGTAMTPVLKQLTAAQAQLNAARTGVGRSMGQAAAAAQRSCTRGSALSRSVDAGCMRAAMMRARAQVEGAVRAAETRVAALTKQAATVELNSDLSRALAPPTPPTSAEVSKLNQTPVKLSPADAKKEALAEKAAEKEVPTVAAPEKATAPKTVQKVVQELGADAAKVQVTAAKTPADAPMVVAKAGTGTAGARAALEAAFRMIRQDWKTATLAVGQGQAQARKLPPKAALPIRRAFAELMSGVHLMYRGVARARVVQLKRLFAALPKGVTAEMNKYLRRRPRYMAGLYARVQGPVGAILERARLAARRIAIVGQRMVLTSRILVGKTRWGTALQAIREFFRGLRRAKHGLRHAVQAIERGTPKVVAAARAPRK